MERVLLNSNTRKGKIIRRIISCLLVVSILATSISFDAFTKKAEASGGYVILYLKDDTAEHWLGNDNAVFELVDNTNGHDHYAMTKVDSVTWSCRVPASTYNVTFNRLSPSDGTQWNSWSAGGRGSNVNDPSTWYGTYHATVAEHGYWDGTATADNDYFHEGDILYLDFYSFTDNSGNYLWEMSDALFYINFTGCSKASDNNGQDISISSADSTKFSPVLLTNEIEPQVYQYVVTAADEGATSLRFFRGNAEYLWNNSVVLNYSDYKNGNNCVKVQGWDDTGYVCPYVSRRHVTQIDSVNISVTGNRKIYRKLEIDAVITGETQYLSQEDTIISIIKTDSEGNEIQPGEGETFFLSDDTASSWNHREIVFTQAGNYKITVTVTDGYDVFSGEMVAVIAGDTPPVAAFDIGCGENEETGTENVYVRDSLGTAHITVEDRSVAGSGDYISERIYTLYYDSDNDGEYTDEEIIERKTGNEISTSYELSDVGNYRVKLEVTKSFEDSLLSLTGQDIFLSGSTFKDFEIDNQAPVSSVSIEKSRNADIIFALGKTDEDKENAFESAAQNIKEKLEALGIETSVETVYTGSGSETVTEFDWQEYDHLNYYNVYAGGNIPHHITYGNGYINMGGYIDEPYKDFLYVEDAGNDKKTIEFIFEHNRLWGHSMEGGGFLFNTMVSEEENYIQGYCMLLTKEGLKLIQIDRTGLTAFRDGHREKVQQYGRLLRTFEIDDTSASHRFRMVINGNVISIYDGDTVIADSFAVPDDGVDAYGFGPIMSNVEHDCWLSACVCFAGITVKYSTGESIYEMIDGHDWSEGTNRYVIHLSEDEIPELADSDSMADAAGAILSKEVQFFGIGNDSNIDRYNALLNTAGASGESICLTESADAQDGDGEEVTVASAAEYIADRIRADIEGKDYTVGYTITTDEKIVYKGTYSDAEGDEKGSEIWKYVYDASVFGEENQEDGNGNEDEDENEQEDGTVIIETAEPLTVFADAGAYTVSHRVSDDPTGGNSALEGYIRWSGTDDYEKLILAQNRPAAAVTASLMQKPSDSSVCLVNVIYDSSDPDHPSDAKKGIREERFFYKEAGETEWTEGRFPSEVEMGKTYLVRYEAKDIEGTWSYPAVAGIKTNEAREYVKPNDTTPPICILTVSRDTAEAGETIYIEAEAADDYGVAEVTLEINGTQAGTKTGRYAYTPDEPGETEIVLTAADICGNIGTAAKTVMVYDRSDVTPPVIDIVSPKSGMVSGSIDIMGSITDNKKLAEYKIMLDRVVTDTQDSRSEDDQNENEDGQNENDGNQNEGGQNEDNQNGNEGGQNEDNQNGNEGGQNEDDQNGNEGSRSESILIAEGTEAVRDAKIATLDTTELAQGMYRLEITAKDKAGNSSESYLLITVVKDHTADRIPPTAVIDSVTSDEEGSAIEVIGTVTDETGLAGYTLKAYHELQNGGYGDEVLSVSGGSEKIQEVLAGIDTDGLASGSYILVLTAVDGAGNTTSVTEKFTYDVQTGNADIVTRGQDNEPPVISATAGAEIKNGNLDIDFKGTIYDDSALLYTVTFGKKTENGNLSGALVIAAGNENIENGMIASYSFSPYEEAVYALVAEAEDEYGNSTRKEYIIRVTPNGTVYEGYDGEGTESDEDDDSVAGKLYIVPARTMADTSESISVYITYPDTAGNVKLVLRNRKTDEEKEIPVHGTKGEACAENAGEYEIILSAYINGARKSVSADVWFTDRDDDVYPAAVFTSPEEESVIKTATDIRGTVNDDKLLKYYTLEYRQKGTDEYTEISRGTEPVTDGVLGTLDTTMLLNGRYELRLTAVDMGGHVTRTERYINVEGNLKVGNMSIGFTDITSNVAGIPLALTRNYDSRNKASGDFGTGWSMGLMDIRLTESSDIVSGYSMAQTGEKFSTAYYITQTMCHDITVTYGDGTSDRFVLTVSPERQAIIPIYEVNVGFRCVTNPKVKLSLNGDSSALLYGSSLMFEDTEMMEYHSYILTREDGSRLYLDEQRGLLFMEDTNGNRVSVTNAGFRHSDGKGIIFTRDAKNRIIKAEETDSSANVINRVEYAYDSNDNLISVTDNAGRVVGYTYDDDHNLIDIIDPSGVAIARNEYDEDGRLVATIDADGNRIEYEHDIDGRTEAVKDRRGNTTVYTYDDNGNVLKTVDALGNVTVNTYDNNNNILTKTDALGNVTSYKYDSNNNLITTVNKEGIEISSVYQDNKIVSIIKDDILFGQFGYDYNGNVSSVTDANGNTTELTYDSKGNMLSATDKIGVMMSYKYDSNGNVSEAKDANGNIILYTRDESGRCIKTSTLRTTSSGTENIEAYYSYDSDGNIVSKTDPLGNATHYNYDVLGNLSSLINSDGNETKYEYDSLGNLVKITYCDNTFETFVYDANGNTISATNTYGQTVYMAYDKVGRMISKT